MLRGTKIINQKAASFVISALCLIPQRITRTEEIPVAVYTIDAADGGPEFALFCPWRWESGELSAVGPIPVVTYDHCGCVW